MAQKPHSRFRASQAAENAFAVALRKVARQAGHVVEMHVDGHRIWQEGELMRRLEDYSKALEPWARRQAQKMMQRVSTKSKTAFTKNSREMARLLKSNVAETEVGVTAFALMNEQVALIKSIPLKAALRAQRLAQEAAIDGSRASDVAEALMRSGKVSESDANLIARTEVARANASLVEARATAVGSKYYRWRNSGDESVRHSHKFYKGKRLDGMIFEWSKPPTLDDGMTGNPGTFPNCRCYAEPIFDDEE